MRIAILVRRLHPAGGAEQTMFDISNRFENSHDVKIFGFTKEKGDLPDNAYSKPMPSAPSIFPPKIKKVIRHFRRTTAFRESIIEFNPDIILAQHRSAVLTPYLQQKCNANIAIFLHDLGQIEFPYGSFIGKVYSYVDKSLHQLAYSQADLVVANSKFIAKRFQAEFGFYPRIIYPCINIERFKVRKTGDKILFANPIREKGIRIVLDIANQLPDEEFLIVGPNPRNENIEHQMNKADNIIFRGFIDDISDAFKESKLLLYPSQWQEPFGRLPIEAGASGIPTIASDRGGLPESVGIDDCIVHSDSPDDYVNRIQTVLENHSDYSTAAQTNTWKKSGDVQYSKLKSYLRQI